MAKGLAEATNMIGGALFDQCKSDVGTDVGRTPEPPDRIDLQTPFSHHCIVLSHTSAFPLHEQSCSPPSFPLNAKLQVCALAGHWINCGITLHTLQPCKSISMMIRPPVCRRTGVGRGPRDRLIGWRAWIKRWDLGAAHLFARRWG